MNDIAKETQIELKIRCIELARKHYIAGEGKLLDMARAFYEFIASEDEAITKPEKDHILTTEPCIRCGKLRIVRKYPHGTIHDDCFACGYPKAEKTPL